MDFLPVIIGSLLLPIAIVAFVITLITRINRHAFKTLLETSSESMQMPSQTVRTTVLQYGFSRYNNVVKLGEQNGSLFIKIPLLPIIQIPYKNLKEVKRSVNAFNLIIFTLHFKGENQKILTLTLREKELELFPGLEAATQKITAPSTGKALEPLRLPDNLSKVLNPTRPFNGDHLRNFFLVAILVAGLVYWISEIV